jgi:hypothetical protein
VQSSRKILIRPLLRHDKVLRAGACPPS